MKQHRLLLTRKYFGLGDWVMLQSVLKAINTCYPDLPIDLDITKVPGWFQQLTLSFDAKVTFVHSPVWENYLYTDPHVSYHLHKPITEQGVSLHLIEAMLLSIEIGTGLKLSWDKSLAQYKGYLPKLDLPPRYILMPSCGMFHNNQKDWPVEKFYRLSKKLKPHIPIIQIGRIEDPLLSEASHHFFNLSPGHMQVLISQATAVVALENGLSHWSGHLSKPTVTLYIHDKRASPEHTGYPNQHPLIGPSISVEAVYQEVMSLLKQEVIISS
jgi:ADP-heptose:LPS heptosyltransferase